MSRLSSTYHKAEGLIQQPALELRQVIGGGLGGLMRWLLLGRTRPVGSLPTDHDLPSHARPRCRRAGWGRPVRAREARRLIQRSEWFGRGIQHYGATDSSPRRGVHASSSKRSGQHAPAIALVNGPAQHESLASGVAIAISQSFSMQEWAFSTSASTAFVRSPTQRGHDDASLRGGVKSDLGLGWRGALSETHAGCQKGHAQTTYAVGNKYNFVFNYFQNH